MAFEGLKRNWKQTLVFIIACVIFWLIQFAFQYFISGTSLNLSLVRSFAFTGTTLMALSLLSSICFKFKPALMKHVILRRNFGVMGFVFIILHVITAVNFIFKGNILNIFYSLDPTQNGLIFALIAEIMFFIITLTSCDWAVQKLGNNNWKLIQRFVYIAFILSIFHFITQNPAQVFTTLPGYLLLFIVGLMLLGELYWFLIISKQNAFKSKGFFIGLLIILFGLILAFFALKKLKFI